MAPKKEITDEQTREKMLEQKQKEKKEFDEARAKEVSKFIAGLNKSNKSGKIIKKGNYQLVNTSIDELLTVIEEQNKAGFSYLDSITYGGLFYILMIKSE